tara:strand:+ start:163 stop:393 length:231 start_codon:yes stop_codon:yes gene_type:complete
MEEKTNNISITGQKRSTGRMHTNRAHVFFCDEESLLESLFEGGLATGMTISTFPCSILPNIGNTMDRENSGFSEKN